MKHRYSLVCAAILLFSAPGFAQTFYQNFEGKTVAEIYWPAAGLTFLPRRDTYWQ